MTGFQIENRLSVLVPTIGTSSLAEKLQDLRKISGWVAEVVVCFNGAEEGIAPVRVIVEAETEVKCVLSVSEPFRKAIALREGLALTSAPRVLYTDVDCFFHSEPGDLQPLLETQDVSSFLILRRPTTSDTIVRAKLARRRVLSRFYGAVGLLYLSARGGGYVAGNMACVIDDRAVNDDLLFTANYAAAQGTKISPSEALVFYEMHTSGARRYADKLPRLIFGDIQAYRLAKSRRVRASLAVQKISKCVVVALIPPLALAVLFEADLPLWFALGLLLQGRLFVRTWEGLLRGLGNIEPRW